MKNVAELFGLKNSNRDFSKKYAWGKNQFNSSFPASLTCYMQSKNIPLIYLKLNKQKKISHAKIKVKRLLKVDLLNTNTYFAFETPVNNYQSYMVGTVPRIDMVLCFEKKQGLEQQIGLEVKLTALPDNTTAELTEKEYGAEIVVRPDTIAYLAVTIAKVYAHERKKLKDILSNLLKSRFNWNNEENVAEHLPILKEILDTILLNKIEEQEPLLLQPIWKTKGKTLILADNCFDVFVWSNFALTRLFVDSINTERNRSVNRKARTLVWVIKMLEEFSKTGKIDYRETIDTYTYDTKNDKAFAINGYVTHTFMSSQELLKPRLKKEDLKNIILGGGEKLLSPERRFDAAVINQSGLFQ